MALLRLSDEAAAFEMRMALSDTISLTCLTIRWPRHAMEGSVKLSLLNSYRLIERLTSPSETEQIVTSNDCIGGNCGAASGLGG